MQPAADAFLARWHRIVAERDLDALAGILADGVATGAPPYWTPLAGKPLVHHLLGIIANDAGRVAHLDVLIRPMNALEALREVVAPKMMAFLAAGKGEPEE